MTLDIAPQQTSALISFNRNLAKQIGRNQCSLQFASTETLYRNNTFFIMNQYWIGYTWFSTVSFCRSCDCLSGTETLHHQPLLLWNAMWSQHLSPRSMATLESRKSSTRKDADTYNSSLLHVQGNYSSENMPFSPRLFDVFLIPAIPSLGFRAISAFNALAMFSKNRDSIGIWCLSGLVWLQRCTINSNWRRSYIYVT